MTPRRHTLAALAVVGALALATGCGDDDDTTTAEDAGEPAAPSEPEAGAGSDAAVQEADSDLGQILTTDDGLTVYGFTEDTGGTSSCEEACAEAWPPVTVEGAEVPAGLDADVFGVTERPDGTYQLVAGDWPLYTFAGDAGPGDTNGQGSDGAWFVVSPDGELVRDAAGGGDSGDDPSDPY